MLKQNLHLQKLYNKWTAKEASPEEVEELLSLLDLETMETELEPLLKARWEAIEANLLLTNYRKREIAINITSMYPGHESEPVVRTAHRVHFIRRWGWAVAVILLVCGVGVAILKSSDQPTAQPEVARIIPAGQSGAILTLADGSKISLDSVRNGAIAVPGGDSVHVLNGILVYDGEAGEVVYHTMSTPNGRQFQLTLPDGTRTWLNSASSIRYPTHFSGNQREVEVSGEVFFDIVKNPSKPFRVNVRNTAAVEVLGTQFNINAYENEATINTTLLTGSIRVLPLGYSDDHFPSNGGASAVLLTPGEQARISSDAKGTSQASIVVAQANVNKVIAWKNGLFDFTDLSLPEAMRQLERWYDISIIYKHGIPKDVELNGKLTRDVTLNDLLVLLQKAGLICQLEGRRIIVLNK